MKKTRYLSFLVSLLLASELIFSGCSNDDDDKSTTPGSNPGSEQGAEADKTAVFDSVDDAAFTVLRSLTDLTQYDPEKVTDEDGSVSGIETLPDDWNTLTFSCDEGFVLDETKETVRALPVNGFGEALEFFSSIIGESLTEDNLTGGTYTWSYGGLGTLTFREITGNEDLYATIDVSLPVMPKLTRLQFVPASVVEKSATASNKFYGKPYFHAGDVIRRNKDGTYWICVRPAGGPFFKDNSYWIALDAYDDSASTYKSIIKSEKKKVKVFYDIDENFTYDDFEQEWVYAKNLMTLKIAKAAFHTFSALVTDDAWGIEGYENAKAAYEALKGKGIDLLMLHRGINVDLTDAKEEADYRPGSFCFAYGSPKNDSNRSLKLKKGQSQRAFNPNVFKTAGQIQYVQPFVSAKSYINENKVDQRISTYTVVDVTFSDYKDKKFLFSLTDSFDVVYSCTTDIGGTNFRSTSGRDDEERAESFYYDFTSYLCCLKRSYDTASPGPLQYVHNDNSVLNVAVYKPDSLNWHVIVAPELKLADNKGAKDGSTTVKPVKDKDYTEIYVQGNETFFDYWATFTNTKRYIDNKEVDWAKENKE